MHGIPDKRFPTRFTSNWPEQQHLPTWSAAFSRSAFWPYIKKGTRPRPLPHDLHRKLQPLLENALQAFHGRSRTRKKQLIAERDAFAERERNVLFISLTLFSLLVCGAVFAASTYRNKHAIDRIRLILKQKEETIRYLRHKKETTNHYAYK